MLKEESQGRIIAGRYRVLRVLGAGAQGTVYMAEDLGRGGGHVALKLVEHIVGGERREAADDLLRHFRHPHWAAVSDAGPTQDDGWFQTVELIPGRSLDHITEPQSAELVWQLLEDGARVLGALHRLGVLHYDVTPGNVMLDKSAATPRFVLTDGGLAHLGPVSGVARGTPQTMAPEVTEAGPHDHRADLYSLGLVAFRLATGTDPVEGGAGDVLGRRRREPAPRARTRVPDLPAPLDDLIATLLSRDPNNRPHDALALLEAIATARSTKLPRFLPEEGVAAAEGGTFVGNSDALTRMRETIEVLQTRTKTGSSRLATVNAPSVRDPVVIVRSEPSGGATRACQEAIAIARDVRVPTLLISGRDTTADRRGPLRHLVDGMASLARAPGETYEEIRLDLGARKQLGREERAHAITRAVEQFVRGVEATAARTPFLLVVQDFDELPARAKEGVRVLSRHLLAMRENGGSASAPPVALLIDVGREDAESLLVPDAANPDAPLLTLEPLSTADSLAFMAARFPGMEPGATDLERIAQTSEGLPGTLAALLAEGCRRTDLRYESGRWGWNIDGISEYEIRHGLPPVLAEALHRADDHMLWMLQSLSLLESPLEAKLVQRLWSMHAPGLLPATPLLRSLDLDGETFYTPASRALRSAVLDGLGSQGRRALEGIVLAVLDTSESSVVALDRARLTLALGDAEASITVLADAWPDLSSAARASAQRLIHEALSGSSGAAKTPSARIKVVNLLEYGPHALACATLVANELRECRGEGDTRLALALLMFESKAHSLALDLLDGISNATQIPQDSPVLVHVLRAQLLLRMHKLAESEAALTLARRTVRPLRGSPKRHTASYARFLMVDAQVHFLRGQPRRARLSLRAARLCAKRCNSPSLLAQVYSNLGIVEQELGHYESASVRLGRALRLRRYLGDVNGTIATLTNLGRLHQHTGALVKSAAMFQAAANRALRYAQPRPMASCLLFLGRVYDQQMNSRLAASTIQRAVQASERAGFRQGATLAAWDLAPLAAALGDMGTSRDMLLLSAQSGKARLTTYARATHHLVAALSSLHSGDDRRAAVCFERALRQAEGLYEYNREALGHLGRFLAQLGVRVDAPGTHRPRKGDTSRFVYRTALWFERASRTPHRYRRPPINRYLPRAQATEAASGRDRRLLAEVTLRAARLLPREHAEDAVTVVERNLAMTGERYIQARALAIRSVLQAPNETPQAAQLFSRAIDLVDVVQDQAGVHLPALPQEHAHAHAHHAQGLGLSASAPQLRTLDSHALAHRMLLKHGFTAAPDGRVASALRRVLAATMRMNAGAGLDDLLQGMTDDTIDITGAERACVVLLDRDAGQQMRVEKGASSHDLGVEVEDLSQTVIQRVIESRTALLLHDVFDDEELMGRPSITSLSLRSILCVPMLRGDTLYGVLYADSASAAGSFDSVDQEVLSLFSEQAAAALETHRLVADVQNSMAELKAVQERLVRGERLRTMGELSSGVAHEFNNLLTSILARVQLIALDPVSPELKRDLDLIERACLDAAEVVRRLQSFTRKEREGHFVQVNFAEICNDAVEFLRPLWSTRRRHGRAPVTVRLRTDPDLPVDGDATELREVVTNLLKNSLDALPDGGKIELSARALAGGVELHFQDDGPGIPEEIQARVFDPFFTTKGERGTGLGLCLSQQIIERHGGEMTLESSPGKGTHFTIELPRSRLADAEDGHADQEPAAAPLRVLVVDDDENVRLPLCRFLEKSGYELLSAADGEAGLAALEEGHPDVVISDVAMPGMNGIELCRRVRELRPNLPVILMSGWASGVDPSRARRAGATALLKKPFALQQVETALRTIAQERDRANANRGAG